MSETNQSTTPQKKNNTLLELFFNIVIPSIILMKLSSPEYLGTVTGLIVALAFPVSYAIHDFIKTRSLNFISLLGFLSTLLTGGIALFELSVEWLAIKEAAIPAVIGTVVLASGFFGKPLLAKLLLNPYIFKLELIYETLAQNGNTEQFKRKINNANLILASTFGFSSTMNYILAKWIVTSPTGTVEFNEQLGEMTLLSYPVIAIPSLIMMFGILFYVIKVIAKLTGLTFEEMLNAS
ncbi:VC0807 family protein [Thalassotalea piscium]|uniref:Intracellular septation protein A n=1 Tax=Thalassotalea piscium TaxID=1230533 RepID=A0A7X0TUE0_9GAMM|nr:VC0807 family protein [Thalassotalea piscium]MBB6544262.1 intracellular septation protein A [Thalassotalea piscium]